MDSVLNNTGARGHASPDGAETISMRDLNAATRRDDRNDSTAQDPQSSRAAPSRDVFAEGNLMCSPGPGPVANLPDEVEMTPAERERLNEDVKKILELVKDAVIREDIVSDELRSFETQKAAKLNTLIESIVADLKPTSDVKSELKTHRTEFTKHLKNVKLAQDELRLFFGNKEASKDTRSACCRKWPRLSDPDSHCASAMRAFFTGGIKAGVVTGILFAFAALGKVICEAGNMSAQDGNPTGNMTTASCSGDYRSPNFSGDIDPAIALGADILMAFLTNSISSYLSSRNEIALLSTGESKTSAQKIGSSACSSGVTGTLNLAIALGAAQLPGGNPTKELFSQGLMQGCGAGVNIAIDYLRDKYASDLSPNLRYYGKIAAQIALIGPLQQAIRTIFSDTKKFLPNIVSYGLILPAIRQAVDVLLFKAREMDAQPFERQRAGNADALNDLKKLETLLGNLNATKKLRKSVTGSQERMQQFDNKREEVKSLIEELQNRARTVHKLKVGDAEFKRGAILYGKKMREARGEQRGDVEAGLRAIEAPAANIEDSLVDDAQPATSDAGRNADVELVREGPEPRSAPSASR